MCDAMCHKSSGLGLTAINEVCRYIVYILKGVLFFFYLFLYFYKIVRLINRGFLVYVFQGGTGVPCNPFLALLAPLYTVGLI